MAILEEVPIPENQEQDPDLLIPPPRPENDELFTKRMRTATKNIHKMSDALVNARLSLAMSDDKVWAEGLLIFYEVFRFLEAIIAKHRGQLEYFDRMGTILDGFERTKAFEESLNFYYGKGFLDSKSYVIRPKVEEYLKHLRVLEEREPLRLLAYIYHLYMGLLSGGQILKKKREIKHKFATLGGLIGNKIRGNGKSSQRQGDAVTRFELPDGRTISDLKKEIAFTMNDIASDLSEDEKDSLISESILVFQYNNEIIRSVRNVGKIAFVTLVTHPVFITLVVLSISLLCYFISPHFLNKEPEEHLQTENSSL